MAQLQCSEVQAALGPVEQYERVGLERGELERKLRSDRACCPSDQDTPAADLLADLIEVQPDLLAAEEVFGPDLLELADPRLSPHELVERRHRPEGHAAGPAAVENTAALLVSGGRDRDQDHL